MALSPFVATARGDGALRACVDKERDRTRGAIEPLDQFIPTCLTIHPVALGESLRAFATRSRTHGGANLL